jgi:hypothetical protein
MALIHRLISLAIAVVVAAAAFVAISNAALESIVVGAAVGFAYWYWGPTGTLL